MKQWWQQLNSREQKLVAAMGTVFCIFLLYSFIWQPLNEGLDKSIKKLARQQALLTWVNGNTERYQQMNASGPANSGSLSSIVNRTASDYQITVTRMQPQGDDLIQVWIDEVAFQHLLTWLEQLSVSEGLQVKGIDLSRAEQPGVVSVRRLQLGKS
jgi:general secretion pathway protein M